MFKCPIYNEVYACDRHPDCLFNRDGGCAIVLGATIPDENAKKLGEIDDRLANVEYILQSIVNRLR